MCRLTEGGGPPRFGRKAPSFDQVDALSRPPCLSISNSSSRRHRKLHQPPAVRDPTHLVDRGPRGGAPAGVAHWRMALQRRVAPCRIVELPTTLIIRRSFDGCITRGTRCTVKTSSSTVRGKAAKVSSSAKCMTTGREITARFRRGCSMRCGVHGWFRCHRRRCVGRRCSISAACLRRRSRRRYRPR